MEQAIYDIIEERQSMKRDNGQSPDSVSIHEIHNAFKAEILESLRDLYRKGLVGYYKTLNGIDMFNTKETL